MQVLPFIKSGVYAKIQKIPKKPGVGNYIQNSKGVYIKAKQELASPQQCEKLTLYQLLFKMVVKSDVIKLEWDKANNLYSATYIKGL